MSGVSTPRAALRIVRDVAVFRLRRLEMANLAGAAAVAAAVGLPGPEIAGRLGFGALLNLLVYLNNDYMDVDADLASTTRAPAMTRFLAEHRGAAALAQVGLLGLLVVIAGLWRPSLLVPLIAGGGICWAYSARLKRLPGLDVAAMVAWGVAMSLVGAPLAEPLAWALVLQLGLFSGVFEAIQVLRDRQEDAAAGVRTTAVALGERRTQGLIRGLLAASGLYACLVIHPAAGAPALLAMALPLEVRAIPRYWTQVRAALGLTLLGEAGFVAIYGETAGLLLRVGRGVVG
ncbi:MAG: UbiA family prenyltransferase [Nannocystis sp.]|nr:UbiA family prenyltransferase [Nannocystis sp.]